METDRSEPLLGIMKALNVEYVLGDTPDDFARLLRLIAEGEMDAASMVTATVGVMASRRPHRANPEAHTPRLSYSRGARPAPARSDCRYQARGRGTRIAVLTMDDGERDARTQCRDVEQIHQG
jgi:hypothetical protein